MKALHMIAWILLIIGGLNWLVFGLFQWDIGMLFGGMMSMVSRIIYVLVGLSALYELFTHKANCKMCSSGPKPMAPGM
jgi:uncharacterized protein